jgi:DNA polymerase III alpha subunit
MVLPTKMVGVPSEEFLSWKGNETMVKEVVNGKETDVKLKDKFDRARQQAKPVNFGVPGGLGVASLVAYAHSTYKVDFSFEEAKERRELLTKTIYRELDLYLAEDGIAIVARNLQAPIEEVRNELGDTHLTCIRKILTGDPKRADGQPYQRPFVSRTWASRAQSRMEYELGLIAQRDLAPYFLLVGDIAQEARRRGWPMALRGSGGSSLVCYLLGITDIDPVRHGLRVERFLNPGRDDLPDIDLDLAAQVRRPVFAWVLNRYGADHVARVGTIERLQAASAFKAAASAHGLSIPQARAVQEELGRDLDALAQDDSEALGLAPPSWPLEPQVWPRLVADARSLVGRPQQMGVHPAGIVLTASSIDGILPVQKGPGGVRLSQLNKDGVEHIGLVKIDLLSNRALSTLAETRQHLQALAPEQAPQHGEDADPATLALLASADTLGISQLETPALRRLLRQVAPRGVHDLAQVLAVSRPGAASCGGQEAYLRRRRGQDPPSFLHACLEPILRESYGLVLYEDDALSVAEALTGLPATEADRLRRRLADGNTAPDATLAFVAACERHSITRAVAEQAGSLLRRFERYTFCKAHAISYGHIAWQEASLKARHPLAFWVAALNNHQGAYPRRVHVEAAKRSGLAVHLPCINRSQRAFSQEGTAIRTGLSAVRGLSESAVQAVLEERDKGGPFTSLPDLRRRLALSPQDLAVLIRVGALDCLGRGRAVMLREADVAANGRLPAGWREEPVELWPCSGLLTHPLAAHWAEEWQLLGFWAGGVPLLHLARSFLPHDLADSRSLPERVGEPVRLAGLATVPRAAAEDSESFQLLVLEDEWGFAEVVALPGSCASCAADPAASGPLLVAEGRVEEQYGVAVLVAEQIQAPLPVAPGRANSHVRTHEQNGRVEAAGNRRTAG